MSIFGNLVMHFHKIAYIPWFHYTELWDGQGAGPHNLKKGDVFLCPWTKVYRFSTKKYSCTASEKAFWIFVKIFVQNLSSRLSEGLNFHFIWFFTQSRNSAYFPRPITLESSKSPNSIYIKLTINNCHVLWIPLYVW